MTRRFAFDVAYIVLPTANIYSNWRREPDCLESKCTEAAKVESRAVLEYKSISYFQRGRPLVYTGATLPFTPSPLLLANPGQVGVRLGPYKEQSAMISLVPQVSILIFTNSTYLRNHLNPGSNSCRNVKHPFQKGRISKSSQYAHYQQIFGGYKCWKRKCRPFDY